MNIILIGLANVETAGPSGAVRPPAKGKRQNRLKLSAAAVPKRQKKVVNVTEAEPTPVAKAARRVSFNLPPPVSPEKEVPPETISAEDLPPLVSPEKEVSTETINVEDPMDPVVTNVTVEAPVTAGPSTNPSRRRRRR